MHTRRHKCEGRYLIRRDAATKVVPAMHDEGPHTTTLPFVSQGATREKAGGEKDRDTHQGGGREKVQARDESRQRKGKRATKTRTKQGVASSRARDARREEGTAGTRHTAGSTPHRSTREGSTRGTREMQHHAPRHAPHRHQTHRTHPHPPPQHVASEPLQPAQRAGSRGRGSARPQNPPTTADGAPTGDALPPPPRRETPARKGARRGAGAGSPRPHRPHPGHTGRGTLAASPGGRAAGGGTAPDTRRPSQRWQANPPRGRPPTTPTARSPHRACRPRGQCWAPTPTHPRPQHVSGGPQRPAQWAGSQGRGSA